METADLCGKIGRKTGRRRGVGVVVVVVVVGGGGGEIKQKSMGRRRRWGGGGGGELRGKWSGGSGPVILSQSTRSAGLVGVDDVQANRKSLERSLHYSRHNCLHGSGSTRLRLLPSVSLF